MSSKSIPFDFVLELLFTRNAYTKPMFGAHGIYVDNKIVLIVRDKPTYVRDNGVWLATTAEHHKSLSAIFPNMRSLELFGTDGPTGWQILPMDAEDFEESVTLACELILKNDPRIGKIPKSRTKKIITSTKKAASRKKKISNK